MLCRLLVHDGWRVVGTTRSADRVLHLQAMGVEPVVVDVYDRRALQRAVAAARPKVVVHQLTDLPKAFSPEAMLDRSAFESVATLEQLVLTSGIDGLILRYGRLYGPGTWTLVAPKGTPVHVDAAAEAARCAMSRGSAGVYNVAEDDGTVATTRAQLILGWNASFRLKG